MTDSMAHIEEELEVTRARMDDRLTELRARLTPGQLLDDALDYVRASGGSEFGNNLMTSVRNNPLPVAITGIGLAWLMISGTSGTSRSPEAPDRKFPDDWTDKSLDTRLAEAEGSIKRGSDEPEQVWRDRLNAARGAVLGLAQQTGETAESFGQRITDKIDRARQSVRRGIHDAQDYAAAAVGSVSGAASQISDQLTGGKGVKEAGGQLVATVSGNPLLLGALALGLGALLGAVIPQSETEEEALEGVADKVRETARAVAHEAADRGAAVAGTVMEEAEAIARAHGLSPDSSVGEIVEQAKSGELAEVAEDVGRGALNAAESSISGDGSKDRPTRANDE